MPRRPDQRLEGRIVDVAYHIWRTGGERALTMRAVAKAAKTTTPTLYERFANKRELLTFLRERARQRMFEAVQSSRTALEACQLGLQFSLANGNEFLLLASDWPERFGRKEHLPSFEFLKNKLAEELGGEPADHSRLAMSLVAVLYGTTSLLLGAPADERTSTEFQAACFGACQGLIESARSRATSACAPPSQPS